MASRISRMPTCVSTEHRADRCNDWWGRQPTVSQTQRPGSMGARMTFQCARWMWIITCNSTASLLCTWVSTPEQASRQPPNPSGTVVLAPGIAVREELLRCTYVSSSGPGGQNVNKRSTKAQLRVLIDELGLNERARRRFDRLAGSSINSEGELVIQSDATRSQAQNKKVCIDKLKELVLRAVVEPKKRRPTKPTRGSIERRIDAKKRRGETKRRRRNPEQ